MMKTDEQLKKSIVDHLYWNDQIDASGIKVEVSNSEATLSGRVLTFNAKDAASAAAWMVNGINKVNNHLRVIFPTGLPKITDEQIKSNAQDLLAWNSDIHSLAISVDVSGGVVTLGGNVDTYWKKEKIKKLVSDLLGVVNVINNLVVIPTERLTDQKIASNIQTAISNVPMLQKQNIRVSVNDSVVTLKGSVVTWLDSMEAHAITANCRGVTDILNKITISP